MWPWLLILAVLFNFSGGAISPAQAAPTSLGPTSAAEAAILWNDGQAAFQLKKYRDACSRLQRLVDRYPGYPDYKNSLQAYRLLGESYLLMDQPKKAILPLRHFTATAASVLPPLETGRGKLLLGKAYLGTGRFHEAYLLSLEFERPHSNPTGNPREIIQNSQGFLIKTRALMGLGRYPSAEALLESLESAPSLKKAADTQNADYLELRGTLFLAQLEFKLHECAKLPSSGKMDEAQARVQLERRGVCLQEAVIRYQKGFLEIQPSYLATAEPVLTSAFAKYQEACHNPPSPPPLRPKDRTPLQLKKYRRELAETLQLDCEKSFKATTDLLVKDAPTRPLAASIEKLLEKKTQVNHDQ